MGDYAHRMQQAGVQLIGGCCGSDPSHVKVMKQVVRGEIPVPNVELTMTATADAAAEIAAPARSGRRRRRR